MIPDDEGATHGIASNRAAASGRQDRALCQTALRSSEDGLRRSGPAGTIVREITPGSPNETSKPWRPSRTGSAVPSSASPHVSQRDQARQHGTLVPKPDQFTG